MKGKNFKDSILYIVLMCVLFTFVVPIIISLPFSLCWYLFEKIPEPYYSINNVYLLMALPSLISFIILFSLKDNNKIRSILSLKNNKIIRGLFWGFILNAFCVLMAYISGSLNLVFDKFNILVIIYAFIGVLVPAIAEELMCRGYIQNKLLEKYNNPKIAIIVNSVVFLFLHMFHDGVTITALISTFAIGVLLSLITYYNKNIWEAIFIHATWNFTQSIMFGLPNSGVSSTYAIFKVVESSNNFAYNTVYGIESSIIATLLFIGAIIIIQQLNRKK